MDALIHRPSRDPTQRMGSLLKQYVTDHQFLGSIVVSIPICHAGDRSSIPLRGYSVFLLLVFISSRNTSWIYLKKKILLYVTKIKKYFGLFPIYFLNSSLSNSCIYSVRNNTIYTISSSKPANFRSP